MGHVTTTNANVLGPRQSQPGFSYLEIQFDSERLVYKSLASVEKALAIFLSKLNPLPQFQEKARTYLADIASGELVEATKQVTLIDV